MNNLEREPIGREERLLRSWNEQRGNVGDDKHFISNFLNLNKER